MEIQITIISNLLFTEKYVAWMSLSSTNIL
jgi:hypothetical protein